ncbi:hypothetical protein F4779DRAFT_619363 [Xylariaceae sp. FL0662B]|nr:hypothetical protein F4779DRAFT_619363 [Xylariaceae sp. FL0662B]
MASRETKKAKATQAHHHKPGLSFQCCRVGRTAAKRTSSFTGVNLAVAGAHASLQDRATRRDEVRKRRVAASPARVLLAESILVTEITVAVDYTIEQSRQDTGSKHEVGQHQIQGVGLRRLERHKSLWIMKLETSKTRRQDRDGWVSARRLVGSLPLFHGPMATGIPFLAIPGCCCDRRTACRVVLHLPKRQDRAPQKGVREI